MAHFGMVTTIENTGEDGTNVIFRASWQWPQAPAIAALWVHDPSYNRQYPTASRPEPMAMLNAV